MRLISQVASVVTIVVILACYGALFTDEDDTQIIRRFIDLSWKRGHISPDDRQSMIDWAHWCKDGIQLGEFEICPPR